MDRREFLGAMAVVLMRLPGHPILDTIEPVLRGAKYLRQPLFTEGATTA